MGFTQPITGTQGQGGIDISAMAQGQTWNPARIIKGLASNVLGVDLNATGLFQSILTSVNQLKAIDWNATDEELRALAKQQEIAAAAAWGGAIGQSVGRLAGFSLAKGVQIKLPVFSGTDLGKEIGKKMIDDVKEEALDEVRDETLNALRATAKLGINIGLINTYIATRSWIKSKSLSELEGWFGSKETAYWFKYTWGSQSAPVMSFNAFMDEKIETIKNPVIQAGVEEFLEEAWDAFVETGFIVTRHIDEAYIQAEIARLQNQGVERTINLIPDENAPNEFFVIEPAPQEEVIQQATGLLNQYRTLRNRSVGTIVGQSVNEAIRAMPQMRRLELEFRPKPEPPWILPDGKEAAPQFVRIPNPKKGLTFNQIKLACSAWQWGQNSATLQLADRRKIICFGATEEIAKQKLAQLKELTASKPLKGRSSQVFDIDTTLKSTPQMMYPVSAKLMFRTNLTSNTTLETVTPETVDTQFITLTLWMNDPAPGEPSILP